MSKKDRLAENEFSCRETKDGKVFVYWRGRLVRTYTGMQAAELLADIAAAPSSRDVQYALARVTGNFKRGNERTAKAKRRR